MHLFTEAKKLAFADRARFYADPRLWDVPVKELISKEYQPGSEHESTWPSHRPTWLQETEARTWRYGLSDRRRQGPQLLLVDTEPVPWFGSQVVPGRVGFALQNRGNLFSLDETHPNRSSLRKRPSIHTIIPAMVTKDGEPWFCFGVMGGDMQPQGMSRFWST